MDKVLVILSDNNKGKFISKGFASAFKDLSYFVYEKKIYDLNVEEIKKISPKIIFIFWTDVTQVEDLCNFLQNYSSADSIFIHCAELLKDIAFDCINKKNHYLFYSDSKSKRNKYIPAIDSKEYKTKFRGFNYDITFSGNPAFRHRELILAKLIYNFGPINIFCRSFDFYKSVEEIQKLKIFDDYFLEIYRNSYRGYVETQKELSKIYASSKINIDMAKDCDKSISYRCLEILASGGFLIAPKSKELITKFEDGIDLETYLSTDELVDKIRFYLSNLNIAQYIAINGKKNTVSNHSFYDRLKKMLKVIYGKNFSNR